MSSNDDQKTPVSLTYVERQTLLLLHQVLSHMDTGQGDHHEKMMEVLEQGYTFEYDALFALSPELDTADSRLVFDILGMFSKMKSSLNQLPEDERKSLLNDYGLVVAYRGLDYNDTREGKMAGYVTFQLKRAGRWTDLAGDVEAEGGNSHMPMLHHYQAMLNVYRPVWAEVLRGDGDNLLTSEHLRRIGEARG